VQQRESSLKRYALAIFRAALTAAEAGAAVRRHLSRSHGFLETGRVRLPIKNFDRIFLIAAGKAALEMAAAIEAIVGPRVMASIIVTKRHHRGSPVRHWRVFEAGHPIPDRVGVEASAAVRELLKQLNARDLLLVAISGGASALLSAPVEPITLEAKQETTDLLLRAGASISELNVVRKHLSSLKGGRLAALAYPATVVSLLLSDVIGDPVDVIGSGPTAPDSSTFADALAVLQKFDLLDRVPKIVRQHLMTGKRGKIAETPKPRDPIFRNVHNVVVGSNHLALEAATKQAKALGFRTIILSSSMQGEAREVARAHAEILREVVSYGHPLCPPACILSGGETTVTIRGNGLGGRNQEFALAAAMAISGLKHVSVLSAGTDGTDGPTDAAGAIATGETIARARRSGLDPAEYLANNDSYRFFDALGNLIKTGPTGTNVMDIHLLLAASS
jgi:hydroxypyruvate reductase